MASFLPNPDDRTREHFGSHQFLNWWPQMSTSILHLNGFESDVHIKHKKEDDGLLFYPTLMTGLENTLVATSF